MSLNIETRAQAFVTSATSLERRATLNSRPPRFSTSSPTNLVVKTASVWFQRRRSVQNTLLNRPLLRTACSASTTPTMRLPFLSPSPLNEVSSLSGPADDFSRHGITEHVDEGSEVGAVEVSGKLKAAIQRLYAAHVSESGVDYVSMAESEEFREYKAAAARLPSLDINKQLSSDEQKIAFYVNLYNAMTQHAIVSRGAPPSFSAARLLWGMSMTYEVGDYQLSIHEIENGILRQNRRISVVPPPFGWFDSRKSLCVKRVDPRIHFVLNCAATSCPPVLFLTVENLESTLQMATQAFLSNKENFRMDDDGCVYLSMIFKWYKADFAPSGSNRVILSFVAQNAPARNEFTSRLAQILSESDTSQEPPIEWLPYDWSLNAV